MFEILANEKGFLNFMCLFVRMQKNLTDIELEELYKSLFELHVSKDTELLSSTITKFSPLLVGRGFVINSNEIPSEIPDFLNK